MNEYIIPEMISLRECSNRTGLSYEFLRSLCLRNEIIHIRSGSKYLVNFGKLCEYLNNGGNTNE